MATSSFFVRRFFRIAPMYYFGILLYGSAAFFCFPLGSIERIGSFEERYSLVGITLNFVFVHGASPTHYNNIVPGGWSIGTEMLFYAAFIPVFWLCQRTNWHLGFLIAGYSLLLLTIIALTNLYTGNLAVPPNGFAYSSLPVQLPAFLCGFLLFAKLKKQHIVPARLYILAGASTLVLAACWKLASREAFPGPIFAAAFPLLAGLAFAGLCLWLSVHVTSAWCWRAMAYILKISFSLYVVHFCFAWDGGAMIKGLFTEDLIARWGIAMSCSHVVLTTAASVAVASVTHRLVERPGMSLGEAFISRVVQSRKLHHPER